MSKISFKTIASKANAPQRWQHLDNIPPCQPPSPESVRHIHIIYCKTFCFLSCLIFTLISHACTFILYLSSKCYFIILHTFSFPCFAIVTFCILYTFIFSCCPIVALVSCALFVSLCLIFMVASCTLIVFLSYLIVTLVYHAFLVFFFNVWLLL